MPTPLKDYYSPAFYQDLTHSLDIVLPGFDKKQFFNLIYTPAFEAMELKQRMRHTTVAMHAFMPSAFGEAAIILKDLINSLIKHDVGADKLAYIFLPDYIEVYGIDDFDNAVDAIEFTTQFISCEFAVRPFLIKYRERMLKQMTAWSLHENYKVRRLASEGSRPRLPWGLTVPYLKQHPNLVLPILENLKNDPADWVRLSVANSLNDIAKTHPQIVIQLAKNWAGISKQTDAVIKHGSRTLLKKGHAEILAHYGLNHEGITLADFTVSTPVVRVGESLEFVFDIANNSNAPRTIRLEYAIYYRIKNGQWSKKVFKISERVYHPGQKASINRKQKFTPITTRVFYPGLHSVAVIVNGFEYDAEGFELIEK